MYLSAFSMMEPEENVFLYYPGWLNVWESHLYNRACKSTHAHGWAFKRFGTVKESYTREMIRKPHYKSYLDAMEQAADTALQQLTTRERMLLLKSRTAFIYADSWGETSLYEDMNSALHASMMDTMPKNILKKFQVKGFSCKLRGEKQSLMQAMRIAQDYLNWNIFDNVIICAAYRALPIFVFSEEDIKTKRDKKDIKMNVSVERVGCFIFSRREASLHVECGSYIIPEAPENPPEDLLRENSGVDIVAVSGFREKRIIDSYLKGRENEIFQIPFICLNERYGESGCLSPALSWSYLQKNRIAGSKMRTLLRDSAGGYNYFDTRY